ncbi:MAG: hypothetical protein Q4D45_00550 [Lachnospiraceae bacterium]|nr:hypothetical protein [Lachnospiraceae bacterium]
MSYYSKEEMIQLFKKYPQYIDKLYIRGFLITNEKQSNLDKYPFYSNWKETMINNDGIEYYIYIHKDTTCYIYSDARRTYFIIGHAYDPFNMRINEEEILKDLSEAAKNGKQAFWDAESNMTGVFCTGYFQNGNIVYSTDCCGMQLVYHGVVDGKVYITSHSKLVADLKDLKQPEYIVRLVNNRFWHYWGTWLPGDLSPFEELKRMQPNCAGRYRESTQKISIERYYPLHKITEVKTEEEFDEIIKKLGYIMSNTMTLIGQKWPDKKVSISVTGGRDSMTTLSCSNGNYDKFNYFSYISNVDESVDAYAAKDILKVLNLNHELYEIPEEYEEYKNLDVFKKIMECNAGCIGHNNENDAKKRLYFSQNPPCDVEVKSWVNEMGRGWYWNKYNKNKFPKYPYASYWRTMHKVYVLPYLIRETDKVFKHYLKKYYNKDIFDRISWLELYFWEFAWSGGEGVFLTSEHRMTYDITVPFNNRKYVELMLKAPLNKRKVEGIPDALITYMEPRITETGIVIKDISHTDLRAFIVRVYLEIFSKIRIPSLLPRGKR